MTHAPPPAIIASGIMSHSTLSPDMEARWACLYAALDDLTSLRRGARYTLYLILIALLRSLPSRWAVALGDAVGRLFFWSSPSERARKTEAILSAFPGMGRGRARAIGARSMGGLGAGLAEALGLAKLSCDDRRALALVTGGENLRKALSGGRGAVIASAHMGCWEYLPAYLSTLGRRVAVVAEPQAGAAEDRLLRRERLRLGVGEISPGFAGLRESIRSLRCGGLVVCPIDRGPKSGGVPALLLGTRVSVPALPLRLSLATGAMIVPAHTIRSDGGQVVDFETPLSPPARNELACLAGELASSLGRWIRAKPEQWIWPPIGGQAN